MILKNKNNKNSLIFTWIVAGTFLGAALLPGLLPVIEAQNASDEIKESQSVNGEKIDGSVIITSAPKEVLKFAEREGLEPEFVHKPKGQPAIVAVEQSPSDPRLKSLDNRPGTKVAPNYVYKAAFTPNDTNYSAQWNLAKISAPSAWNISRGASNVTIAVIDTGVLFSQTINGTTYSQPDFPGSRFWNNPGENGNTQAGDTCWTGAAAAKSSNDCDDDGNGLVDDWRGWDFMGGYRGSSAACPNHNDPSRYESSDPTFVSQDNDAQPYSCDSPSSPSTLNKNHYSGSCTAWTSACFVGHGTMVSSVAAAASDNGQLIAGIDHNAKIMNLRALDGYGYTTTARVVAAINYAVDKGADVINMSLGSNCHDNNFTDATTETALAAAASAGVISVAASGNESMTSSICYPASSPHVVAVGATDQNDKRHSYSNYSNKLDVVAPAGVPVANSPSAFINSNYYASAGGTSLATPHVAGLAALLKAANPDLGTDSVFKIIQTSAAKVSGMKGATRTDQYGYGRINLYKSTQAAITGGYGNIRLIDCSDEKYVIERGIKRKRPVSQTAVEAWALSDLYFKPEDPGCSYPTYNLALDRIVRSRDTGKEYLVTAGKAYYIDNKSTASSWGIVNYNNTVYPQLGGSSIKFLNIVSKLPSFSPNMGASNIRLFKCDEAKFMVERNIRRKRLISSLAVSEWGLAKAYFSPNDRGCSYPAYNLALDRIVRSRDTGKEYLIDNKKAYWIRSQEALESWGIMDDYENTTYPQLNGPSIKFLEVVDNLPAAG